MHISDSKGNLSRRVVPLSEFDSQHLTSNALPAVQMPGLNAVTACEIVASSALSKFKGSLTRDLSSRQLGYLLHTMAALIRPTLFFKKIVRIAVHSTINVNSRCKNRYFQ